VLCAYVCGEQAVAWARIADPLHTGLDQLATLFPEARRSFRGGAFHDWVSPPFSGGVHSHLPPGFVLRHLRHEALPAGRVHFAGEHTATWTGFMEGALESAERVACELLEIA
jgi:monoamine oxidase